MGTPTAVSYTHLDVYKRQELVALGKELDVPVVTDLGSGSLVDLSQYGLPKEDVYKRQRPILPAPKCNAFIVLTFINVFTREGWGEAFPSPKPCLLYTSRCV